MKTENTRFQLARWSMKSQFKNSLAFGWENQEEITWNPLTREQAEEMARLLRDHLEESDAPGSVVTLVEIQTQTQAQHEPVPHPLISG